MTERTAAPMLSTLCPVCHYTLATPFFDGGRQPLATLGWPASAQAAQAMARHPLDYVLCPRCTHVWNRSFTYEAIPYEKNPNRMFNAGSIWRGHLAATRDLLITHLPPQPFVVEVGCGEGHFLRGVAESIGAGRFAGFDPNASSETGRGVEFHARYFNPLTDIPALAPDAIVMRHVLEHLTDPAAFVEQLAWGAGDMGKPVLLFAEMPCIDRVHQTGRLADLFYEHPSQFSTRSFQTLMERAGEIVTLGHGYDGEVVYALVRLGTPATAHAHARSAASFSAQAVDSRGAIGAQLDALAASGKRVAIWGGTGKAAAFMHFFGADGARFPLVVDSDPDKTGTHVPGTGQLIQFRDVLKTQAIDAVIIPTQWRARDIVAEMKREGIAAPTVYIEHQGRLVDFFADPHPY